MIPLLNDVDETYGALNDTFVLLAAEVEALCWRFVADRESTWL